MNFESQLFRKLLVLIAIKLTLAPVSAQSDPRDGFIITNSKDTIYGLIDYRTNNKNYESCIFSDDSGTKEFLPDQINGFGYVNDKFFISGISNISFVEVLIYGHISLYKYKDSFFVAKKGEIIELTSKKIETAIENRIVTKKDTKWKGYLSYLIGDCLQNPNEVASNLDFTEKSLTEVIVKYNRCLGNDFIEYKSDKSWTKFNVGLIIGLTRSEIRISGDPGSHQYLQKSYNTYIPSAGLLFTVTSPRITERISFQCEFIMAKSSYSGFVNIRDTFHDTFINLSTISFPLSFKYSFPEKTIGFYTQGGVTYDYHYKNSTEVNTEQVYGNIVFTTVNKNTFDINDFNIGVWGGIGIQKSFKHLSSNMSFRYYLKPQLTDTFTFIATNNQFSVNLILLKK